MARELWVFLRNNGIDAVIDQVAAGQRQDWALWMAEQIREAEVVLCVASKRYRERAEGRSGSGAGKGAQWEARLIRDAFHAAQDDLQKFVPVVVPGQTIGGVPDFLAPSTTTVYFVEDFTFTGAERLLRFLLGQPEVEEITLGDPPVFDTWKPKARSDDVVTGAKEQGQPALSGPSDGLPQDKRSKLIGELERIFSVGGGLDLAISSSEDHLRHLGGTHELGESELIVASLAKSKWWSRKLIYSILFTTWGLRAQHQREVFACAYSDLTSCEIKVTREVAWRDPEYPTLTQNDDFLSMSGRGQTVKIRGVGFNPHLISNYVKRIIDLVRERPDLFE